MFTLGLLVPPVERREVDRRRRLDPAVHQGHGRREPASTGTSASTTGSSGADWSTDDARWRVTAERTDTGETVELTCGFLFSCTGYYRYDHGYLPDFPGMDRFAGTVVHPQALARGPRLRRQAGRGHRQRRHRRDAGAVAGRDRRATSPCSSARRATSPRCRPATRWPNCLRRVLPDALAGHRQPVVQGPRRRRRFYQLSRRRPGARQEGCCAKGLEQQLPDGYDIDTHFTPQLRPVGPAAVRRCPTATCSRPSAPAPPRWSPTTSTRSPRRACGCESGDRARGRHHRHRHRARAALPRRHRR